MLTPLKREKFDQLIPLVPTSEQYQIYWGDANDFFRRLLISVALLVTFTLLYGRVTNDNHSNNFWGLVLFISAALGGLYWMLAPVYQASLRNQQLRQYGYGAIWIAEVYDSYISQEISQKKANFDRRGKISVDYDTDSFLNLELVDQTGLSTQLKMPMRREYKRIRPGDLACLVLVANDPGFSRVSKLTSDAYFPQVRLWAGAYPYLRKDLFEQLVRYLLR